MKMINTLSRLLGMTLVLTLSPAVWGQTPPEKSKIALGYSSMAGSFGAFWVAEEKGYFKEQGLDVKTTYTSTTAGLQAMMAGQFDAFGAGCPEIFEAARRGFDVKTIAAIFDRNPYLIVGRKDITKPEMLVGKSVAVGRIGDNTHLVTRYALRRLGVDPGSVTYVQLGSGVERFSALTAGSVAASVQSGFQRVLAIQSGLNVLIDLEVPDEPSCPGGIAVSGEMTKRQPRTIDALLRGLIKGNAYLRVGPEADTQRIFAKYMRLPPDDKRVIEAWSYFRQAAPRGLDLSPQAVKNVLAVMAEGDPSWAKEDASRFLDLSFINKLGAEKFADKVYEEIGRNKTDARK